jgi:hypothetical protein
MDRAFINLDSYTPLELTVWTAGAVMFVAVYILVFINMFRRHVVWIPAFAYGANFAWEFLWGYVYQTDMGTLFSWGLKFYMPMSLAFGFYLLRYGYKQFRSPWLRSHLAAVLLGGVAFGVSLVALLKPVDDAAGMSSVMFVNLVLSGCFLSLVLNTFRQEGARGLDGYTHAIGWLKLLGGVFNTAFCVLHLPERGWVHAAGYAYFVLDVAYLYLFYRLRASRGRAASGGAAAPGGHLRAARPA